MSACEVFPFFERLASISPLLTPVAIVGVGIWVNTTIRKRNHKTAFIANYLQDLRRQIHNLISDAVDAETLNSCTVTLRALSNEITHLIDLSRQLAKESANHHQDILQGLIFEMKRYLTDPGSEAHEEHREYARQAGNKLRSEVLQVVMNICDMR